MLRIKTPFNGPSQFNFVTTISDKMGENGFLTRYNLYVLFICFRQIAMMHHQKTKLYRL